MFYVYLLESLTDGSFYVGSTNDLKRRFKEYNEALNLSTQKSKPWKIIYYEACLNLKDAHRREKWLKTTQGSRMVKARIREYLYENRRKT